MSHIFADDVIFQFQRLNAIRQLTERNQTSVFNIITKTDVQTFDKSDWIKQEPDFAAVAHDTEYRWLNGLMKGILKKISRTMTQVKCLLSLFCPGKGCLPSFPLYSLWGILLYLSCMVSIINLSMSFDSVKLYEAAHLDDRCLNLKYITQKQYKIKWSITP